MENPPTPDRPPESYPESKDKGPQTENILDPSQTQGRSEQPTSEHNPTTQVQYQQEHPERSEPLQGANPEPTFTSIPPPQIPEFPGQSPYLTADMARHISQSSSSGRSPQYQLVSPGTPSDPRAMSQVSPGFIFVNFLSLRVAAFLLLSLTFPMSRCPPSLFFLLTFAYDFCLL